MSENDEDLGKYLERLDEKLSSIEQKMGGGFPALSSRDDNQDMEAFRVGPGREARYPTESNSDLIGNYRDPLPDKRLVQRLMDLRNVRSAFFSQDMFGEPAWDMLLDLVVARIECRRVSITSLCIASGVAPTTALRWITILTEEGLVDKEADDRDARRTFVCLSDAGAVKMGSCFAHWQNARDP